MKNELLRLIATNLTERKKGLSIPPGSALSTVNLNTVFDDTVDFGGLDVKIARIVGTEVANIRNVILPVMKDYRDRFNTVIANNTQPDLLNDFNIKVLEVPAIIKELDNRNTFDIQSARLGLEIPVTTLVIPAPKEGIANTLLTNITKLDILIGDFINEVSDEDITRVWETYLSNVSSSNTAYGNIGRAIGTGNDLFILYLIVRNIKTNIPDGVKVGLSTYNSTMNVLEEVLANRIYSALKRYDAMSDRGVAIIQTDDKCTYAHGPVYNQYLKDGGEIETILGFILGSKGTGTIIHLDDNKDKYASAWDRYVKLETVRYKSGVLSRYKVAYQLSLKELINDLDSNALGLIPEDVLTNLDSLVVEYLESVKSDELLEVGELTSHIVACVLYGHTNAHSFFDKMMHYAEADKTLTSKEAASFATLDLVVDYILTQIKIS